MLIACVHSIKYLCILNIVNIFASNWCYAQSLLYKTADVFHYYEECTNSMYITLVLDTQFSGIYQLEGEWKSCQRFACDAVVFFRAKSCPSSRRRPAHHSWNIGKIFIHLQAGTWELCILHASSASWEAPTSTIVPLHIYASGKFCMTTFCPPSFNIMHKVYCTKLAMCYLLMIMTYPFDATLVLPRIYVLHANLVYLGHLLLRLQGQDPMHMSV